MFQFKPMDTATTSVENSYISVFISVVDFYSSMAFDFLLVSTHATSSNLFLMFLMLPKNYPVTAVDAFLSDEWCYVQ